MKPIRYLLGTVVTAVLAAGPGLAGVVLKGQGTNLKNNATSEITMFVDTSRLRIDTRSKDGKDDVSMILRIQGDDYQMIALDNRQKQYWVMDRKTMAEVSQTVSNAMAQLEAQLKNMTPEQRAMMEKMMGKKMGEMMGGAPGGLPPISYRAAGAGIAGGRPCKKYDVFRGDEKISEVCTVRPESMGLGPAELAVFEKMKVIYEDWAKMLRQLPGMTRFLGDFAAKQIDGFPVQQVIIEKGQPVIRFEFGEAARRSFSEADFSTGDAKRIPGPTGR
jgi:hypothetical protein